MDELLQVVLPESENLNSNSFKAYSDFLDFSLHQRTNAIESKETTVTSACASPMKLYLNTNRKTKNAIVPIIFPLGNPIRISNSELILCPQDSLYSAMSKILFRPNSLHEDNQLFIVT